jgi:hypothetical protein
VNLPPTRCATGQRSDPHGTFKHHPSDRAARETVNTRDQPISRRTGLSRNTIAKYLSAGTIEPKFTIPERPSKLDSFADKLAAWLKTEAGKPRSQVSFAIDRCFEKPQCVLLACFGEKRESCTLFCWLKPNETVRISKTPACGLNLHLLVLQCLKDRFQACNEAMGSSDGAGGCSCTAHGRASRPWIWGDAAAVSRRRSRLESPLCVTRLWD